MRSFRESSRPSHSTRCIESDQSTGRHSVREMLVHVLCICRRHVFGAECRRTFQFQVQHVQDPLKLPSSLDVLRHSLYTTHLGSIHDPKETPSLHWLNESHRKKLLICQLFLLTSASGSRIFRRRPLKRMVRGVSRVREC